LLVARQVLLVHLVLKVQLVHLVVVVLLVPRVSLSVVAFHPVRKVKYNLSKHQMVQHRLVQHQTYYGVQVAQRLLFQVMNLFLVQFHQVRDFSVLHRGR